MNSVRLYDYQQEMLDRLMKAWKRHRSVMVQMPTGTGKTHLMAEVIRQCIVSSVQCLVSSVQCLVNSDDSTKHSSLNTNNFILIVAHRRELIEQIRETLAAFGLTGENVRVESIQRLSRHIDEECCSPSLVVIDEAHHALAKTYRVLWEKWQKAKFLGLTATPCRMNGNGFTDLFDVLVQSHSIAKFVEKGYLSLFNYVSLSDNSEDMRLVASLKKRGADGDYQRLEMESVFNQQASIERLFLSMQHNAKGLKGIVYAISVSHARAIAEYYTCHGVNAVTIDSNTPANVRREYIERFRNSDKCSVFSDKLKVKADSLADANHLPLNTDNNIDVLVNVDIFSEGFDCPDVGFVQLARPTLSLAKYLQMVGRGLRRSKGKSQCVIIDNVGLHAMFGLPTKEHDWQSMFKGRAVGVHSIPEWLSKEGKISFVCDGLVKVGIGDTAWYYDLRNDNEIGRRYRLKQTIRVMRFGNVEILRIGDECHTRTRIPMTFTMLPHRSVLENKSNHVEIHCWHGDLPIIELPWKCEDFYTVCIFDDEPMQMYVLYRKLEDGRLVVYKDGDYWLYEKEKAKKRIASKTTKGKIKSIDVVINRLEQETRKHKEKQLEEERRQLQQDTELGKTVIEPFRQSMRWGLRSSAGRIIVPAIYRKVYEPVGSYCTFMNDRCDYGVMTICGKIVVEARYMKAELQSDGTVNLMRLPGIWEKVELIHNA